MPFFTCRVHTYNLFIWNHLNKLFFYMYHVWVSIVIYFVHSASIKQNCDNTSFTESVILKVETGNTSCRFIEHSIGIPTRDRWTIYFWAKSFTHTIVQLSFLLADKGSELVRYAHLRLAHTNINFLSIYPDIPYPVIFLPRVKKPKGHHLNQSYATKTAGMRSIDRLLSLLYSLGGCLDLGL